MIKQLNFKVKIEDNSQIDVVAERRDDIYLMTATHYTANSVTEESDYSINLIINDNNKIDYDVYDNKRKTRILTTTTSDIEQSLSDCKIVSPEIGEYIGDIVELLQKKMLYDKDLTITQKTDVVCDCGGKVQIVISKNIEGDKKYRCECLSCGKRTNWVDKYYTAKTNFENGIAHPYVADYSNIIDTPISLKCAHGHKVISTFEKGIYSSLWRCECITCKEITEWYDRAPKAERAYISLYKKEIGKTNERK